MSDQQGDAPPNSDLGRTPLYDFHKKLDAKMVPFAGYEMPVSYPLGVLKEHLQVRSKAGLFDVSHMGQGFLIPADKDFKTAAHALEKTCSGEFCCFKTGAPALFPTSE